MLPALITLALACGRHRTGDPIHLEQKAAALQLRATPGPHLVPQTASPFGRLALADDPTGSRALSVGADGLGTLWDLDSGAVLAHVPVDLSGAAAVSWTRAGVLWVDSQRRLRLLDATTWTEARRWPGDVVGLAVAPSRERALVARPGGRVDLLDLRTHERSTLGRWRGALALGWMGDTRALVGRAGAVDVVELAEAGVERGAQPPASVPINGRARAIGSGDRAVIATGSALYTLDADLTLQLRAPLPAGARPTAVAAWPGGMVAAAVETLDPATPEAPPRPEVYIWPAGSATPTPVEHGRAITPLDREGVIVALASGEATALRPGEHPLALRASAPSLVPIQVGASWALTTGADGGMALWDLAKGRAARTWVEAGVRATALSSNGLWAAVADETGTIKRWAVPDGVPTALALSVTDPTSLALSDDGSLIVGGGDGRVTTLRAGATEASVSTVSSEGPVLVAIRPDGRLSAVAGADGALRVINLNTGATTVDDRALGASLTAVVMSRDGERIYLAGARGQRGEIWGLDGERLRTITPPEVESPVLGLTLAPNGRDLVFSTTDGQLCTLYSPERPTRHTSCFQDPAQLDLHTSLGVVPGPRPMLVSAGASGLTRLWRWDARPRFAATLVVAAEGQQALWAIADAAGHVESSWSGVVNFVRRVDAEAMVSTALSEVGDGVYVRGLLGKALREVKLDAPPPDEAPPPEVSLVRPMGGLTRPTGAVCVSDLGQGSVRVLLNGWEVPGAARPADPIADPCLARDGRQGQLFEIEISAPHLLDPIESNIVEVSARRDAQSARSAALRLVIDPDGCEAGLVTKLAPPDPAPGSDLGIRAVVAGTAAYPGSDAPLAWPSNDARAVKQGIELGAQELGLALRGVDLLISDGSRSADPAAWADKANLERAIGGAAQDATERDTLVLYLAGHGAAQDGEWYYLLSGFDFKAERYADQEKFTLSSAEIRALLTGTRAHRVILILDTCEAGVAAEALGASPDWGAIYVLAASRYGPAFESDRLEHGLLTWSLLDALSQSNRLPGGGLWDVDVVLPLASQGVLELGDQLGLGELEPPLVARPRVLTGVQIGKTPPRFREDLSLATPAPRLDGPKLLDAETLVDQAGLSELLASALRDEGLIPEPSGANWYAGGMYYGSPEQRCVDLRVYQGNTLRGQARARGADPQVASALAPWLASCVVDGVCTSRPADPPECP